MKHIDGYLYVAVAVATALAASLNSDEASTLISAATLFWLKSATGAVGAGALAAKMYRSTTFAAQQAKDAAPPPDNTAGDDAMSRARKTISMISQPNLDAVADGKISDGATLVAPPPSTKTTN